MKTAKKKQPDVILDWNTPEGVEQFRKAAKANARRLTRTPELALATLVADGIYTKTGRLTKRYR